MGNARRSIAQTTTVTGTGLHTGAAATLTFRPADGGSSVTFRRTDLPGAPVIPADLDAVQEADRRTSLGDAAAQVHTVEHVLAAVAAHGIDDILIELDGPEPPIGDGSAAPYFRALDEAGIATTGGAPTTYRVRAPLALKEGDASYVVAPGDGLRLTVTIEWDHPAIGRQSGTYDITPEAFGRELAEARTFGFREEADELRQRGLIQGASASNTVILSKSRAETPLRWPDEFVRHKAADLLGDLALLGGRLEGSVVAFRPSHRGNVALGRAIRRNGGEMRTIMGIPEIMGVMPHRYPMLLVDRIVEFEPGKRIVGIKNVTINEPFFQGHFPGHPVMPGVLIIEGMAQAGGMLLMDRVDDPESKVVYFMSLDNVKFRRPVTPGDQLRFELEMLQFRGRTCRMRGVAYVENRPVAEAEMMARIVDR